MKMAKSSVSFYKIALVCLFVCFRTKTSYWFSPFEVDKRPTVSYYTDTSYCPSGTVSLSFIPPDNIVQCYVA